MQNKKTDYRFKLIYAIMMLQIVAAHCQDGALNFFNEWIPYGNMLSVLIFSSGYFYSEKAEQAPLAFIKKKCLKLLLPLYIWNIVYGLLVLFLRNFGFSIGGDFTLTNLFLAPIYDGHQFEFNLAGWYIIPLFLSEVLYLFYRKLLSLLPRRLPETLIFVIALVLGVGGIELAILGYNTGWWLILPRLGYFFGFYALGVYYRRVLEKHDVLSNLAYFAIIALVQMTVMFFFHRVPSYLISWCKSFPEGPLLPFVEGAVSVAFWLRVCRILEPGLGRGRTVNAIADHSFAIMLHQFIGFMLLKTFYAVCAIYTGHFLDFDMAAYKSDIFYYYVPQRLPFYSLILYVAAGVAFPLALDVYGKKLLGILAGRFNKGGEKHGQKN